MDLLKAEIERKKKANQALLARTNPTTTTNTNTATAEGETSSSSFSTQTVIVGTTRFMKQSDLIRAKELEHELAQKKLDEEREQKKRKRLSEVNEKKQIISDWQHAKGSGAGRGKGDGSGSGGDSNSNNNNNNNNNSDGGAGGFGSGPQEQKKGQDFSSLTVHQVKMRLRGLGHPITLFGESDPQRVSRLIVLETEESNNMLDEYRRAEDRDEDEELDDEEDERREDEAEEQQGRDDKRMRIIEKKKSTKSSSSSSGATGDDSDDDEDHVDEEDKHAKFSASRGFTHDGDRIEFSKIPGITDEKLVYKYFRALLKQWEWDLNARPDAEKITAKGKMDTKTQKQCKDYIRPLFKLCKKKQVEYDVLIKLVAIVKFCEEGNFRAANDQYLQTAIGNAAWPIGLTMVGIHERSGREKISTSKVAHVMNNELQRKYLTSVKRLLTYAQSKRPDVGPSMKVS